jgi:hypothetical protein
MAEKFTPGPFRRPDKLTITGRYQIPQGMSAVMGGYPVICTLEDQPDLEGNAAVVLAIHDMLQALLAADRWFDGWCASATCCASTGKEVHLKIREVLKQVGAAQC